MNTKKLFLNCKICGKKNTLNIVCPEAEMDHDFLSYQVITQNGWKREICGRFFICLECQKIENEIYKEFKERYVIEVLIFTDEKTLYREVMVFYDIEEAFAEYCDCDLRDIETKEVCVKKSIELMREKRYDDNDFGYCGTMRKKEFSCD